MTKMKVSSVSDLVRIALTARQAPAADFPAAKRDAG